MAQNVNLSVSGLYTSMSDFNGLPPGALEEAVNVESPFKNILVPRNGFERLDGASDASIYVLRGSNFNYGGVERVFGLRSDGTIYYYNDSVAQTFASTVVDTATDSVTVTAHGYVTGVVGQLTTTGALPTGLSAATDYYIIVVDANTIAFAISFANAIAGTKINITAQGSGNDTFTPTTTWVEVDGFSTDVTPPSATLAKSRFVKAAQNLYLTSNEGVRSLSPAASSPVIRAGVPKGLDLEGSLTSDLSGFLESNTVSFLIPNSVVQVDSVNSTMVVSDPQRIYPNYFSSDNYGSLINLHTIPSQITVGLYVGGYTRSTGVIQNIVYESLLFGTDGDAITIQYVNSGGAISISVVGTAITVNFNSGVSTAGDIVNAINADASASLLVEAFTVNVATPQTAPVAATNLTGGDDDTYTAGTTVTDIINSTVSESFSGDITTGTFSINNVASLGSLVVGDLISGSGIPDNSYVIAISGGGPYSVLYSNPTGSASTLTATGTTVNRLDPAYIIISDTVSTSAVTSFYTGSQVRYRMVFGRVEQGTNGISTTKLGSPSTDVVVTNTLFHSTNVSVTGTLPKNASDELTFVQLYRSPQTATASASPPDQERLVYERDLTASDFTTRTVTITDERSETLRDSGIALYTGTDQEGIGQSNDPPPVCYDMCRFRDFALYGNVRYPGTIQVTIVGVGSPDGIQVGDVITIAGTYRGASFTQGFTAAASEDPTSQEFEVFTSGTSAQNIADTTNSLIRVINYDEAVPVHAILLSTTADLPGQMLLEADDGGVSSFTANASAHTSAYDPAMINLESDQDQLINELAVSKSGELDAVPPLNQFAVGDSSSRILRIVPLRDYVFILKEDGIYKGQGYSPGTFSISPFDDTTKLIGPDTAVALNSVLYMFSNQGVVTVDDSGVQAKSIPVDNELNSLIGSNLSKLIQNSFAVGYETKRKYILSVPTVSDSSILTDFQYVFNYITNTWSNWDRTLSTGFINSDVDRLYIGRKDAALSGADINGLSKELSTASFTDYVDEAFDRTIVSKPSDYVVQLDSVDGIETGDILYVTSDLQSMIVSIDVSENQVTVINNRNFVAGACEILPAIDTLVTWKGVFADNPAFQRQFYEGLILFKKMAFNTAALKFATDYYPASLSHSITGYPTAQWGKFPWGLVPWGGKTYPKNVRFLVPSQTQYGSYLRPGINIRQGYSDFIIQGISLSYNNVSQEVGRAQ